MSKIYLSCIFDKPRVHFSRCALCFDGNGRPVRRSGIRSAAAGGARRPNAPLADRLRPTSLDEVVGQEHLTGPDGAIGRMVAAGKLASMILWGPPGTGKTSIARLLADAVGLRFVAISAVFSGVADLKKIFAEARTAARAGQQTLLFVDEIHRFNRAQQDGFLPYVEDGTVTLVGATTENPSFELNAALLSRCQVLILRRLDHEALDELVRRAEALEGRALPRHHRSARGADRQRRRRRPLPAQPGRDVVLGRDRRAARPRRAQRPAPPPRAGLRQGPRGALQPHLARFTKASAARTRRRRFIISRGCSSPARSRSTCSAA